MVLEHLTGRTLSRALKVEGLLSEQRIAKIAGEVCQSLAEAHAKGLVHRDLKPDNIMLVDTVGDPDFVKVLDFGIVKVVSGSSAESSVAKAGVIVGTPQYMSPEQALQKRNLTPAVDIYSLGVVIYQALTGVKPFDGDSALHVLMAHLHQPVPELPAGCAVSAEMRSVLKRMLAKDPEARPHAVELVETFERLRDLARGVSRLVPAVGDDSPKTMRAPGLQAAIEGAEKPRTFAEAMPSQDSDGTVRIDLEESHPRVASRGSRRRLWAIAGAIAVSLTLGIGYLAMPKNPAGGESAMDPGARVLGVSADTGANPPEPVASRPPASPEETNPADAVVPARQVELSPPEPQSLRIHFDSTPRGATVLMGGVELGKTPFEANVPGPPGRRGFLFTLKGYEQTSVTEEVRDGSAVAARLKRVVPKVQAPRPKRPGVPAPEQRKKFTPVDD